MEKFDYFSSSSMEDLKKQVNEFLANPKIRVISRHVISDSVGTYSESLDSYVIGIFYIERDD